MNRYLCSDLKWWAAMAPAFLLSVYFVWGWIEHRSNPSTLLSAIGAISAGVVIACAICARNGESPSASPKLEPVPVAAGTAANQQVESAPVPLPPPPPKPANPWLTKGLALFESNQYRDALYCFTYVLQSEPDNQAALTAKGNCLMKMNRPEEALKAFMQAAQIDGENPLAEEGRSEVIRRARAAVWS